MRSGGRAGPKLWTGRGGRAGCFRGKRDKRKREALTPPERVGRCLRSHGSPIPPAVSVPACCSQQSFLALPHPGQSFKQTSSGGHEIFYGARYSYSKAAPIFTKIVFSPQWSPNGEFHCTLGHFWALLITFFSDDRTGVGFFVAACGTDACAAADAADGVCVVFAAKAVSLVCGVLKKRNRFLCNRDCLTCFVEPALVVMPE